MADDALDTIIEQSLTSADPTWNEEPPLEEGTVQVESTEVVEVKEPDAVVEEVKKEAVVEASPDDKEFQSDLEAEGYKIVPGKRENRVPQSAVRKILDRRTKRLSDAHTKALGETTAKYRPLEQEVANYRAQADFAKRDPAKYISIVSNLIPEFGAYIQSLKSTAAPVTAAPAVDEFKEPQPKPDAENGTAYSPEGVQAMLDWASRRGAFLGRQQTLKEVDARLAPIETERKTQREREAQADQQRQWRTQADADVKHTREVWGAELFDANIQAINDLMAANDGRQGRPFLPFQTAASMILLPAERAKLSKDRTKVRDEVITELNGRPAASERSTPASSRVPAGPKSLESIIADQARQAGLI